MQMQGNDRSFEDAYTKVADSLNERMTPIHRVPLSNAQCNCVRVTLNSHNEVRSFKLMFVYAAPNLRVNKLNRIRIETFTTMENSPL